MPDAKRDPRPFHARRHRCKPDAEKCRNPTDVLLHPSDMDVVGDILEDDDDVLDKVRHKRCCAWVRPLHPTEAEEKQAIQDEKQTVWYRGVLSKIRRPRKNGGLQWVVPNRPPASCTEWASRAGPAALQKRGRRRSKSGTMF